MHVLTLSSSLSHAMKGEQGDSFKHSCLEWEGDSTFSTNRDHVSIKQDNWCLNKIRGNPAEISISFFPGLFYSETISINSLNPQNEREQCLETYKQKPITWSSRSTMQKLKQLSNPLFLWFFSWKQKHFAPVFFRKCRTVETVNLQT